MPRRAIPIRLNAKHKQTVTKDSIEVCFSSLSFLIPSASLNSCLSPQYRRSLSPSLRILTTDQQVQQGYNLLPACHVYLTPVDFRFHKGRTVSGAVDRDFSFIEH